MRGNPSEFDIKMLCVMPENRDPLALLETLATVIAAPRGEPLEPFEVETARDLCEQLEQAIRDLQAERDRLRAGLLRLAAALEDDMRRWKEALDTLKRGEYVFAQFPRSYPPPQNDEERWEYIAFWLYTWLVESSESARCIKRALLAELRERDDTIAGE